ncbi:Ribonuclease 3-like protein 2 [Hibiscus syriacus]|uniref:Ribonuclease 3-like protein 2 n=1 Tax=Hibiscus syriacus TaxID=106335 RepID=A0A6A3C8Q7_HIBSY|nr:ribonuclease 3-like protein 2 [Hibiscus syriacus]KAE8723542.1 Ribonuclease 3-like protein 2 [Hibiscus syriacus]
MAVLLWSPSDSPPSDMEASIAAVERILNYRFRDKHHLEDALTHSSYSDSPSYERLEFVGDAALGLAFTNYVYLTYPKLDQGLLSLIRSANISTEKLARVAVKHRLFQFVRHNAADLALMVKEFTEIVNEEDGPVAYGGSMKAPKILADIVESVAAAIYIDADYNLETLWKIFRGLLEPIVTLEDLQQQPQPVTLLFDICQKQRKQVDIIHSKNGEKTIAEVYVDGEFIASDSSYQKDIAKLTAVKKALLKLSKSMAVDVDSFGIDESFKIEGAKQKLHELSTKKKWSKPIYELEKDEGPPHEKKFVSAVKIPTKGGILCISGEEKTRVKEAENSAAFNMLRSLQEYGYMEFGQQFVSCLY